MKRIKIIFMLACILLVSCGNRAANKEEIQDKKETKEATKAEKKMKTIHLTKADFLAKVANYETDPKEWKYLGDKPAVIDFYADWCAPCRMIAPLLEELAAEYGDEIYIYKIDTVKEQELAAVFGINSIPALLFIPMNDQPQMVMGAVPKPKLKEIIDKVLLKK